MVGEPLAKDTEQQIVKEAQAAGGVEVEPLLGDVGALVLDAVALGIDGRRDDGLALVEVAQPRTMPRQVLNE
jgi:hypothetical protein